MLLKFNNFKLGLFQVACCFGSAACSLCCACCPSAKSSTTTRIAYACILLLGTVIACIMLAPGLQSSLDNVSTNAHAPYTAHQVTQLLGFCYNFRKYLRISSSNPDIRFVPRVVVQSGGILDVYIALGVLMERGAQQVLCA